MKRLMHLLSLLLCVGVLCSVGAAFVLPASAADGITFSATAVKSDKFTVTAAFPAVDWKAFDLQFKYDKNVVSLDSSDEDEIFSCSVSGYNVLTNEVDDGLNFAGTGNQKKDNTNSGAKVTLTFTVKDKTVENTTVSLVVKAFGDKDRTPLFSYTSGAVYASRTVTIYTPPASDTSSSHSTDTEPITNTDTNVSTSSGGNSDPVTDTSSTDTKTSTRPTVTDSDSNTNTKTKTSSSDTDTDTHSDTDTQSETSSDSNVTDQPTEPSLTDQPIDPPITSAAPGTTVPVSSALPTDEPEKPKTVSAGALVGISLGVAAALCGVFVFFGYRRRRA